MKCLTVTEPEQPAAAVASELRLPLGLLGFLVKPDYHPDLPRADTDFLKIEPSDVALSNIVTLRASGSATVNLKSPIVVNRHTLVGKHVVPANASEYNVEHPLRVSEVNSEL